MTLGQRKAAWLKSCKAWDRDPCTDIERTVILGEAVYMDALAYITELEAFVEARMDDGR